MCIQQSRVHICWLSLGTKDKVQTKIGRKCCFFPMGNVWQWPQGGLYRCPCILTLVCTLLYPYQYFKSALCFNCNVSHIIVNKNIYANVKCINLLFISIFLKTWQQMWFFTSWPLQPVLWTSPVLATEMMILWKYNNKYIYIKNRFSVWLLLSLIFIVFN